MHTCTKPHTKTISGQPFAEEISRNHRIPGIVTHKGTLVAVADARWDQEYDGGGSDIVVSRSVDGTIWEYSCAAYLGDHGNRHHKESSTLMDPLIVSDGEQLYLFYDLFPAGYSIGGGENTTYRFETTGTGYINGHLLLNDRNNSSYYLDQGAIFRLDGTREPEYTVDAWFNIYKKEEYVSNLFFKDAPFRAYPTSYIAMQTSEDGREWSAPVLLPLKHENTRWQVLGPGSGVFTRDGQIALTVYNSDESISLVYGTPAGGWKTVRTTAAVNESSLVELSDGTLRALVKNSSDVVTYVDFIKDGDSYQAGSAISTGQPCTGWCMVSSLKYSRRYQGRDVILVSCPVGEGLRKNGTVYIFTEDTMECIGSIPIDTGYPDQFYAYSDMTELADGSVMLLYEDGCMTYRSAPWNGAAAGAGYSHIACRRLELARQVITKPTY